VEVHFHAFSATAPVGDLHLSSNSVGYFPTERTTVTYWIRGIAWRPGRTDWTR